MRRYDFIIAGGGLAGLSLAVCIARSSLRGRSMLIVDQDTKQRDDRTFSFWSDRPGPFDRAVSHAWKHLAFHAPGFSRSIDLGQYSYRSIRAIDLYRTARQELSSMENVEFLHAPVADLVEDADGVVLRAGGREVWGEWAFDSRSKRADILPEPQRYTYLNMVFRGWEIEASRDAFDSRAAIMMDFRTPQNSAMRFFYVLPFDERRALVEYTAFTHVPVTPEACQEAFSRYLQASFGLNSEADCQASLREAGSLLATDQPIPRRTGQRTLAIGLRGGRMKPTTGYAFTRIQRDSGAIVRSLIQNGHPFMLPPAPQLNAHMDAIMLEVMRSYPEHTPGIFSALFRRNPIRRVFRFLDEDASIVEIGQIIASLPPGLFLRILARRSLASLQFSQLPAGSR